MSKPIYINYPLSDYTVKILKTYLKFPEDTSFSAMDWKAQGGRFLHLLTNGYDKRLLYGVSDYYEGDAIQMKEEYGFKKAFYASYRDEAKISNEVFSLMIVNPDIDRALINELFDTVDPFTMPNFEDEIRNKVMRDNEKKEQLQKEMSQQIDFGKMDTNNNQVEKEETEQEKQERLQKQIKTELTKRIKAWRLAMKEQQKRLSGLRWDNFLLQRATNYLRPGGILVMITPKELIDDSITFRLVNNYTDIKILRLDDDEYTSYRKCIILAKKRNQTTREHHELGKLLARTKEKPIATFGKVRPITVTKEEDIETYEKQIKRQTLDKMYDVLKPQAEPMYVVPPCEEEEISLFRVGPITGSEALSVLKKSKLLEVYQEKYSQVFINKEPVTPTPLHKGHIMLLLTSGFLNGYIGKGEDRHLVKGSAIKDIRTFNETDEEGNQRTIEREYYNIGVKLLTSDGEFKKIM